MPEYDLVIRGGTLVDGTGIPRQRVGVAVKNGRVAGVSGRTPSSIGAPTHLCPASTE